MVDIILEDDAVIGKAKRLSAMGESKYTDAGKSASAPRKQEASDPMAESLKTIRLVPYLQLADNTSALPRSGAKSPRRERHERRARNAAETETEGSLRKDDRAVAGGKEGKGRKPRPRTPMRSGAKSVRRENYEREQSESGRSVVL